ncbi:MAG: hypothetical protein WC693_00715 [Patescibacteria group bacterium]
MSGNRFVLFCVMLFLGITISPLFSIIALVIYLAPSKPCFIPRDADGRRCCPLCHSRRYLIFPTRQRDNPGFSWALAFGKNQMEYRCQDCTMSWKESGDGKPR